MLPVLLLAACGGGAAGAELPTADFHFFASTRAEPLRTTDAVTGDATLEGGILINRIRWSGTVWTMNQLGGAWADWVVGRGSWQLRINVGPSQEYDTRISSRSGVGGGFIRWNPSAADRVILNTIDPGDRVRIRIQPVT